jgi:hypothetical protein
VSLDGRDESLEDATLGHDGSIIFCRTSRRGPDKYRPAAEI